MGGQFVIRAAAAYPERFLANAYLHGGQLVTDREDSPHRLVRRLRGELYCGFAEKDPQATPSIRAALDEAIAECPVEYQAVVHPPRSRHPRQARRQPRLGADFRNVPAPALDTVVDELTPYFTHEPADPIRRERENSRRLPHSMTGKGHLRP